MLVAVALVAVALVATLDYDGPTCTHGSIFGKLVLIHCITFFIVACCCNPGGDGDRCKIGNLDQGRVGVGDGSFGQCGAVGQDGDIDDGSTDLFEFGDAGGGERGGAEGTEGAKGAEESEGTGTEGKGKGSEGTEGTEETGTTDRGNRIAAAQS